MIPLEQNAAFVAGMEDILELYHQPYDPKKPWVCMDEKLIQLIKEIRTPIPARLGKPKRYDYEYQRNR